MAARGLGDLEQLVLLAVLRLGDDAYAVSVRDEIQNRAGRAISRGAVYVTLDRLQRKGYLRSSLSEPTAARGGKAKRVFAMESDGMERLRASLRGIQEMMDGLDARIVWAGSL